MIKLQNAIASVNRRYANGQNDDDQIANMIAIDKKTKGYTFQPGYDSYSLISDYDRLEFLAEKHGYWSDEVQHFNGVLNQKGGTSYKEELNNKYLSKSKN
ncbi:hypothetical protein [Sphingobacterium mizutaii]|uniref:hypothetical protein n=1 Tax=Sphingobacterium mizutaii TaxID=1010 RepID=UPI0028A043D0|nr:hypothetical protein [Sphingobacterium mizutaii]